MDHAIKSSVVTEPALLDKLHALAEEAQREREARPAVVVTEPVVGCRPAVPLTEADVRRIFREELRAAGLVDRRIGAESGPFDPYLQTR